MPDPTGDFFDQLGRRGHAAVLAEMTGTLRFDLRDKHGLDHWYVEVKDAEVRVSREDRPADCVLHAERAVFDQMVVGRLHPVPALLRRLYWLEGDARHFWEFAPLLPGPPGARHPRDLVSYGRRRR